MARELINNCFCDENLLEKKFINYSNKEIVQINNIIEKIINEKNFSQKIKDKTTGSKK